MMAAAGKGYRQGGRMIADGRKAGRPNPPPAAAPGTLRGWADLTLHEGIAQRLSARAMYSRSASFIRVW